MPVIQNIDTGLAENVPQEQAQAALISGTHEVPIYSPDGTLGSAPISEVPKLLAEGYAQPNPAQLQGLMREAKYSTPTEQLKAAGHGALSGLLPFGIGTGIERLAGRSAEDIKGEEEFNPGITSASKVGALAASVIIPGGQAKVLAQAGKLAGGLAESRIASTALSGAAELALLQTGDEITKKLVEDPHQSMQTAVANVGLAALMGGAGGAVLGSAGPLWEKAHGSRMGQFIDDAKDRFSDLRRGHSIEEQGIGERMSDWLQRGGKQVPIGPAETAGEKFADWLVKKGAAKMSGEGLGASIGAVLGHHVGSPGLGAFVGKEALGPLLESVLPAIVKPLIEGATNSAALKAAADYGLNVIRGENLTGKAVQGLFKAGIEVGSLVPTQKEIDHVENWLKVAQVDPETLVNSQQHDIGHYLPGHNEAAGEMVAKALSALQAAKPQMPSRAPLDPHSVPNPVAQAQYNQTRDIVLQPLSIVGKIKDGTINPAMVTTLKNVYPAYYTNLSQKMMGQIVDLTHKGETIPYKLRLGLSVFLGQPLDSSISPASIMANQMSPQGSPQAQQGPSKASKGSKNALSKLPGMYATPQQANEQDKLIK